METYLGISLACFALALALFALATLRAMGRLDAMCKANAATLLHCAQRIGDESRIKDRQLTRLDARLSEMERLSLDVFPSLEAGLRDALDGMEDGAVPDIDVCGRCNRDLERWTDGEWRCTICAAEDGRAIR